MRAAALKTASRKCDLVHPGRVVRVDEILHLRERVLLARLAEQHHHHDPLRLLDVDLFVVEREQAIDDDLALPGLQDSNLLEMQQIAARRRVEPLLLDAVEDAKRRVLRRVARVSRVQAVEPVERALDLAIVEAGAAELALELVSVRLRLIGGIDVRLEQVHEYVEDGFFHQFFLPRREYRPPGSASTCPSSSSSRSMEESSAVVKPVLVLKSPIGVGEKPSSFNNFS